MASKQLKRGQRISVPYGSRKHQAVITGVRHGRVYVQVDPGSDAPIETFYPVGEVTGAA